MALVSIREVSLSFGGPLLLERMNLQIEPGERVCLMGRNGTGKTTLMKLINGDLISDEGEVARQQGIRSARLEQKVPEGLRGTTFDIVTGGLGKRGELLAEYQYVSEQVASDASNAALQRLDRLHRKLDAQDGWQLHMRVERVLTHLKIDPRAEFGALSGGQKRRVLLAKALASEPDLLLLDEPTNHLDIESIEWLEEYLIDNVKTLLFVTHDRTFVKKVATRVIELDRALLYNWNCDYQTFLRRKREMLEQESRTQELCDKKLAKEETWIRQGTQARTTRDQGRVKALERMREEHAARRGREGVVRMRTQKAERSGELIIQARDLTFSYGELAVIRHCTITLMRGDKVCVIGPNGSGKTTLLRLLLGKLEPQAGRLRHGTRLHVAYLDQMRDQLDPDSTVQDSVNDGNPILTIDGRSQHVIGYLRNFLFPPERVKSRVRDLSGGERTRLMLARLFARPFNVLVMDEPTNDLDMETLELLEELLIDYRGTLLLVSHDRALLNNVVTRTLALESEGQVNEYAGGYDDWLWQRPPPVQENAPPEVKAVQTKPKPRSEPRITFQQKRELEALPQHIEELESEQRQLYETLSDPALYQHNGAQVAHIQERLAELAHELEKAYQRWEFLESLPV